MINDNIVIINHLILSKTIAPRIDNTKFKRFINIIILVFGIICLI
jgi:hypothetical protein